MKSLSVLLSLLLLPLVPVWGQQAQDLGQQSLSKWNIGTANYSGITALGNDRYALVSDKEPSDGFFVFSIRQNATTGQVDSVRLEGFYGNAAPTLDASGLTVRDCEGIAYFAPVGTLFISGEGDQEILEYALDGQPTGRRLSVPTLFSRSQIVSNYGFEALSYNAATHRFWTTTESTLPRDGMPTGAQFPTTQNVLRLQAFDDALQPVAQYAYRMDRAQTETFGRIYAMGVTALTALDDGRLLVLEREANVPTHYLRAKVCCKLFVVNPAEGCQIDATTDMASLDPNRFLTKHLLATVTTHLTTVKQNFANYEGMCLGRTLADGRHTLLLVNDSQGGYGKGPVHLKDYLRVMVLPE
jgi:hypothetical protein